MRRFLEYLDNHSKIDKIPQQYYEELVSQINDDFVCNFSQNIYTNVNFDTPLYDTIPEHIYYNGKNKLYNAHSYQEWQNMHETNINITDDKTKRIKKIKKQTILFEIETISDLIELTNNHPYESDTEYNINLEAIHNIRCELIELNTMIGMETLKASVLDQLIYFIQNLHIGSIGDFKHTVLFGPPGTGKTEVAKIIGRMYSKIGVLKKNIFKKVTRSDLIAGYLGQTTLKTQKVIEECLGGVLFIDEAYSLANGNNGESDSFSKECIDTLCESLSSYKDDLMVIIAGYENELKDTFFKANIGLESRFIWRFKIDEYNSNELYKIFVKNATHSGWLIVDEINEKWFEKNKNSFPYFGRDMENLFTYTKIAHSRRVYGKEFETLKKINLTDLENGFKCFQTHSKGKKGNDKSFIYDMYV